MDTVIGKIITVSVIVAALFFIISGLTRDTSSDLTILSGSENETLAPIVQRFAADEKINIQMKYLGSVEIMNELQNPHDEIDAVWPANSLWISLGDKNKITKYTHSIMTSPVVFAVDKKKAEELGFVGHDVYVKDILAAIESKKLSFIMTSATQSNSGASAYLGFLNAFLNNPDTITKQDLNNPELQGQLTALLSGVDRSAGSSGYLKELYLKGGHNAMVNYESLVIETNQTLEKQGKEPLYVIYPVDGLVIADSPLSYINRGNTKKEAEFLKLQKYLLSDAVQKEILQKGRRTGIGGTIENADKNIFNPAWGIKTDTILSPVRLPQSDVIREALILYQTRLKKPSYTIFALDFSGSMEGEGETQVKQAMHTLLNKQEASKYLLQYTPDDRFTVFAFSDRNLGSWTATGNEVNEINKIDVDISKLSTDGGTDIYTPLIQALDELNIMDTSKSIPAIVLMTDGESNTGATFEDFRVAYEKSKKKVPVFSIKFGSASESQLREISELTNGKIFDGTTDLINAFKQVKGYN